MEIYEELGLLQVEPFDNLEEHMKYPDEFYEQLTKSACAIIKKVEDGNSLTDTDLTFLTFYKKQTAKLQKISPLDSILNGAKKVINILNTDTEESEVDEL